MPKSAFRGITVLVLTAVMTVGCAADIRGEQAVFKRKVDYTYGFFGVAVSYSFYGTYVDITVDPGGENFVCTYKLNDNKTAWLKVSTGDRCGDGSVDVP